LPARLAARLSARLRQGGAGPDGARLARVGAGPLRRRGGRRRVNVAELAERAVAAAPAAVDALAHVTRERSLLLRYAGSRPTQATAIDDLSVELAVLRDGHVGRASTNVADDGAIAVCGRAAAQAAEAAARRGRPGGFPGFPALQPPREH